MQVIGPWAPTWLHSSLVTQQAAGIQASLSWQAPPYSWATWTTWTTAQLLHHSCSAALSLHPQTWGSLPELPRHGSHQRLPGPESRHICMKPRISQFKNEFSMETTAPIILLTHWGKCVLEQGRSLQAFLKSIEFSSSLTVVLDKSLAACVSTSNIAVA